MVLGIAFAALLIAQQASIFWGLMMLTYSQIRDIQGANIWVMDPNMQYVDDIKPMSENELYRVRGVEGVEWAVRLYKGLARARFPEKGNYQQVILIGLDDSTFVGGPQQITLGKLEDLRQPDAIFIDERGYRQLWPDEPFRTGRVLEMNDRRAIIVGVCKASPHLYDVPRGLYPLLAGHDVRAQRAQDAFVRPGPKRAGGRSARPSAERIHDANRPQGRNRATQFAETTFMYYFTRTGIPTNFLITVILGVVVGTAIAGQTFYLFTVENIRQFGTLKALGLSNRRITGMILLQAFSVGLIGYGIGVGCAALFGLLM